MIRLSRIIHGRRTIGDLIKQRTKPGGEITGKYLAFSEMKNPVIFWNITGQCNLACSHCYLGAGDKSWDELSTSECCALIDDLSAAHVPLLIISGGEPLVRGDLWEILAHAQEKGIKTALSSNGTLIDRDIAGRLREAGVEYVGISLDGATAATHDRIRGIPGSFEQSLEGLRSCVSAEIPCGIRMTVTRENQHEVSPLIDLALCLSVPRFCLYWLVPSGRGSAAYRKKQITAEAATQILGELCSRAREIDPEILEILTVDAPQDSIHLLSFLEHEHSPGCGHAAALLCRQGCSCSAGERIANIDPGGDLYPCQFAQTPEFLLGNVRKTPFSVLWEGRGNSSRSFTGPAGDGCTTCLSYEYCRGGCRIRARFSHNGLGADDPLCILARRRTR
ncbi:MAG: radical SAM protein [Methanomicrobiales archaeon]|nr:radical SAM protein [Methanomicrobiales archaeon]